MARRHILRRAALAAAATATLGPVDAAAAATVSCGLRITGLSYGRIIKLATAKKGMRIKLVLPTGIRSLDLSVRRNGKLIARRVVTSRPGTYTHTLKLTRKAAYTVVLRPQGTRAGTPATASFRVA